MAYSYTIGHNDHIIHNVLYIICYLMLMSLQKVTLSDFQLHTEGEMSLFNPPCEILWWKQGIIYHFRDRKGLFAVTSMLQRLNKFWDNYGYADNIYAVLLLIRPRDLLLYPPHNDICNLLRGSGSIYLPTLHRYRNPEGRKYTAEHDGQPFGI